MKPTLKLKFFTAVLSLAAFGVTQAKDLVCMGNTDSGKTIRFVETDNTYYSSYGADSSNEQPTVTINIDEKKYSYIDVEDRWDGHATGYISFNDSRTLLNVSYKGNYGIINCVKLRLVIEPGILETAYFPNCHL